MSIEKGIIEFDFCSGIYGFQAQSMAVFADEVRRYLLSEGIGFNEIKVTVPKSFRGSLAGLVCGVFGRYFYYPLKVRLRRKTSTIFVADSANAAIYNFLPRSTRFVVFLHGLAYLEDSETLNIDVDRKDRLIRFMSRVFKRRGLLNADLILTNSQKGKDDFVRFSEDNFQNEIIVCPLGISDSFVRQPSEGLRQDLGISESTKVILSVAAPDLRKNMELLVSALAQLSKLIDDWTWVHIGGLHKKVARDIPDEVRERLIAIEHVPHENMPVYYSMADVFVLPTLYDTFGWPPLEAVACGCPAIVSDIAPLNQNLRDAAFFVDPGSPVQLREVLGKLLAAPLSSSETQRNSEIIRKRFAWRNTGQIITSALVSCKSAKQ